jgi:hypothetical protein
VFEKIAFVPRSAASQSSAYPPDRIPLLGGGGTAVRGSTDVTFQLIMPAGCDLEDTALSARFSIICRPKSRFHYIF